MPTLIRRGSGGGSAGPPGIGVTLSIQIKTTDYTILGTDHTILVDASGGPVHLTLPDVTGFTADTEVRVKKIDSTGAAVTVQAQSGQLIDGAGTVTFNLPQKALIFVGNGAGWFVF